MSIEFVAKMKEGRLVFVLIPLLLLHLTLISIQIENAAGATLFRQWVLGASAPVYGLSSILSRGVRYAWSNYVWLYGAREENQRLHETIQQLVLRDGALGQMKEENARLRLLLGLNETLAVKSVGAHAVGRAPNYLSSVLYIDRGSDDGVRVDLPVLSASGILGRTMVVSHHHSQVQLISNPDASIGVIIGEGRYPGVLKGSGDRVLDVNYISNTEPINEGDMVLSSGLDGIFPKGLAVGKVVKSQKGKSAFRTIQVEPASDLIRIEEVLILLAPPKTQ